MYQLRFQKYLDIDNSCQNVKCNEIYQIKSNQIFISPAATEVLYIVDIVLYIFNKHNVDGFKFQKFTDGGGGTNLSNWD